VNSIVRVVSTLRQCLFRQEVAGPAAGRAESPVEAGTVQERMLS